MQRRVQKPTSRLLRLDLKAGRIDNADELLESFLEAGADQGGNGAELWSCVTFNPIWYYSIIE